MKYIDADLLRKEIKKRHRYQSEQYHDTKPDGRPNDGWVESLAIMGELEDILSLIDSLQQEQQKVDLEEEIDAIWSPRFNLGWDEKSLLSINHSAFETIARHFYELGLNARKEDEK